MAVLPPAQRIEDVGKNNAKHHGRADNGMVRVRGRVGICSQACQHRHIMHVMSSLRDEDEERARESEKGERGEK